VVFGVSGWCSFRRDFGDGCAGGGFVDDGLIGGERGDEGLERKVVDRTRVTRAGLMNEADRVVGQQRVGGLGDQGRVMGERLATQRGDDAVVDTAYPDGGIGQVDDGVALLVEYGQRPAPAGEFAGDGRVGDHRAFLTRIEAHPPGVQARIGGLATCSCHRWGRVPASAQILSGPIPRSVMPGGFDQQPAGMTVAGLVTPPCTRVDPEEYSVGTKPR
jgi:hypothetical protein